MGTDEALGRAMIIAGLGWRIGCDAAVFITLLARAAALSGRPVAALAIPAFKTDYEAVRTAATALGLPLHLVDAAALVAVQPRCVTLSTRAASATGVASVAEGAALAAAGPGGQLILPRIAGGGATCALATRI